MTEIINSEQHIDFISDGAKVPIILRIDQNGMGIQILDRAGEPVGEAVIEFWEGEIRALLWDNHAIGQDPVKHVLCTITDVQKNPI